MGKNTKNNNTKKKQQHQQLQSSITEDRKDKEQKKGYQNSERSGMDPTTGTAASSASSSPGVDQHQQSRPPTDIVIDEGIQFEGPDDDDDNNDNVDVVEEPPVPIDANDKQSIEHMSLLELGEETMAQAMLIFLLADLRILSATGRIRTKFEHLALDSDRSPRLTSRDYAGFYDYDETDGISASHIMAILLVEILREAEDVSKERNKKLQKRRRRRKNYKPALLSPWATTESPAGVNAAKVFKRDIRAANGMPSLLHCYNEMLSEDVAPRISRVSRKIYPLDDDIDPVPEDGGDTWIEPLQSASDEMDNSNYNIMATSSIHNGGRSDIGTEGEAASFDDESWQWNPQQQQYVMTSTSMSAPPAIAKPQSFQNKERSGSMSLYTQTSRDGGGATGGGASSVGGATPSAGPQASSRMASRHSSNFQVSHFNPNVDIEEDSDDDSVQMNIMTPLRPKIMNDANQKSQKKPISTTADAMDDTDTGGNSYQPNSPMAIVNASIPAFNYKFKEIRERVEKAFPEQLATRMNELTKNFPKGPAARQQQELDEIAQVQNQLLNWGDEDASEEYYYNRKRSGSGHTNPEGNPSSSNKKLTNRSRHKESSVRTNSKPLESRVEEKEEEDDSSGPDEQGVEVAAPSSDGNKEKKKKTTTTTTTDKKTLEQSDNDSSSSYQPPEYHDSDTIRQLILQALDKRDFWRLGFIKTFFREGTVSHVLANSRAEMVWLSDWHTQYECTYAISIDREKKKVLLAFRGAYTESDWRHIVDWYDTATSNPVKEDYPGRAANIRLHSGFHKYLFRVRRDTETTKYDEIAAKLAHYCKMTGPNSRITITGHSLGAALAAIFSLYASTEDRFTEQCGAIECVTFGAPCIGNWRFAGAVKHQENMGRLRIAKFHVKGDSVPHLPPALIRYSSHGAQYWHSGIDVSLPYIRKGKIFQTMLGGQPKPKITYWDPDEESYLGSLLRQFREFYVWNLPLRFWRFALFHTLVEHKKRMALVSKTDPNSLLTKCSLKELYDMRDDLTRRPFWRRNKKQSKV